MQRKHGSAGCDDARSINVAIVCGCSTFIVAFQTSPFTWLQRLASIENQLSLLHLPSLQTLMNTLLPLATLNNLSALPTSYYTFISHVRQCGSCPDSLVDGDSN